MAVKVSTSHKVADYALQHVPFAIVEQGEFGDYRVSGDAENGYYASAPCFGCGKTCKTVEAAIRQLVYDNGCLSVVFDWGKPADEPAACQHQPICGNCERNLDDCRNDPCTMIYPVCRLCAADLPADKPAKDHKQFHISYFPPIECWPNGGYALYQISGDEIAKRIGFDASGNVEFRDSWPGYIGTFANLDGLLSEINRRTRESGK